MTMVLDSQQQRFNPHLSMDQMSYQNSSPPPFSNPWGPQTTQSTNPALYQAGGLSPNLGLGSMTSKPQGPRTSTGSTTSIGSYGSIPVTAGAADILSFGRVPTTASYEPSYTTAPVSSTYAATTTAPYDTLPLPYASQSMRSNYGLAPEVDPSRRYSLPGIQQNDDRRSFADALDASQGMVAMSQETPRALIPNRGRGGSGDSYGFPSTHSQSSSISSTGNHSNYYPSVANSVASDYSTAGSDVESRMTGGGLPRPQDMMTSVSQHTTHHPSAVPPSMMSQFNSKVSTNTQKKHKCKICDKRFTRPSSLQTHTYSHTGEKPFQCDVPGCGRNFSVVSNLRRHLKVHQNHRDGAPSKTSDDHRSP